MAYGKKVFPSKYQAKRFAEGNQVRVIIPESRRGTLARFSFMGDALHFFQQEILRETGQKIIVSKDVGIKITEKCFFVRRTNIKRN